MARVSYCSCLIRLLQPQAWYGLRARTSSSVFLAFVIITWSTLLWPHSTHASILWSRPGPTLVHETGAGADILGGALRRDDSSSDTLYFKFHVEPLSDATT